MIIAIVLIAGWRSAADGGQRVVLYCAHDAVYAEDIIARFEKATGIDVAVRFDSEATKSLGLIRRLEQEAAAPACDVFWNNELLGTQDLARQGLLAPYQGSGWQRMSDAFKEPTGLWTGFGARMRVFIVNTEAVPADADVAALFAQQPQRSAIAKPLYGTTLTHFTLLWRDRGPAGVQAWYRDLLDRGLRVVDGNGRSKQLVADGALDLGWTDTDDAFLALDAKAPVRMEPVRLDDGATIAIPNTVAIITGAPHRAAAEQLVDFLLSQQVEVALANGPSRQVPLGPVDPSELPEELRPLQAWAAEGTPLDGLIDHRAACIEWLQSEYLD
ncbi:MAG: extracellular solute-binding protein [Planctomycetota bacterium]|nr:extracellular solute-binding protein [Planctomycetota bacterium]